MLAYENTGVLKTNDIRINKSVGALGLKISTPDGQFSNLQNETLTAYIERQNGSNQEIATNVKLRAIMMLSCFDDGIIESNPDLEIIQCLVELANGSIHLEENENLILSLNSLISTRSYKINALEYPTLTDDVYKFEQKVLLSGQQRKKFNVENAEVAHLTNQFDKVELTYITDNGRQVIEYTRDEVQLLQKDYNNILTPTIILDPNNANIDYYYQDDYLINLAGVESIEIFSANECTMTLKVGNGFF